MKIMKLCFYISILLSVVIEIVKLNKLCLYKENYSKEKLDSIISLNNVYITLK